MPVFKQPKTSHAKKRDRTQFAALPWRKKRGQVQILLVTTLNTRRWIVPKGWPLAESSPSESAASEAFEEAGVVGEIATDPLGSFTYAKLLKSGQTVICKVHVYPMIVLARRATWPEKGARDTAWCSPEEAYTRIQEPGLRRLIAKFVKHLGVS